MTDPEIEGRANGRSEVTTIIRHNVKAQNQAEYDAWLHEIVPAASRFRGHRGVNVIRPAAGATEYTVVLHFDTVDNLRTWLDSDERLTLMKKAVPRLVDDDRVEITSGIEFWFTPTATARRARPYKQFLVTLSVIYPLTLVIPLLLRPLFDRVPGFQSPFARQFVSDAMIVALIVYAIMPRYTRLVANWLYR
jgi:uncharacterized protein